MSSGAGTPARPRRVSTWAAVAVLAVVVLLAPVVYLFVKLWASTGTAAATTASERAAVAYARPVDKLLTALLDGQYAAVRGASVDMSAIRGAVDEVGTADHRYGDTLRVRPRWSQLSHEIDSTLNQNASGADALRVYAGPIALTQALLGKVADGSQVTRDPGTGSYQLIQVALRSLPDVLVDAGQVSALAAPVNASAGKSGSPDPRLAVAADRLVRAAAEVSTGLRAGTDAGASYAVDLNLLGPLDEFAAAADALGQTVSSPTQAATATTDAIDTANTQLKIKALGLSAAVLDAFDRDLATHADGYAGQRRVLALAGVVIVLAAGAVLWLLVAGSPVRRTSTARPAPPSRHAYEPDETHPGDLHELLRPETVRPR
jgi:hypothetical protein